MVGMTKVVPTKSTKVALERNPDKLITGKGKLHNRAKHRVWIEEGKVEQNVQLRFYNYSHQIVVLDCAKAVNFQCMYMYILVR